CCFSLFIIFFFFFSSRRRHTRSKRDWSSDVCSSDLVQLIIRKRRGIMFTPEGLKLAEHAKYMLQEQRQIEEKLNNMKDHVAGTLRVGVSNFFALNKMPKLLHLFKQKHPDVECQVVTGWSSEMHRLLLNHDVHMGFIKGDYPWQEKKEVLYEE